MKRFAAVHPAWWAMAALWVGAVAVLVVRGHVGAALNAVPYLLGYGAFMALTAWLTRPAPEPVQAEASGPRLWAQVLVVVVAIALTGYSGLVFHGLAPEVTVPGWSPLLQAVAAWAEATLPSELFRSPANSVINPVHYLVVPGLALVLLGARAPELGLGRGHRTWRVAAVWAVIPALIWAVGVFSGTLTPGQLVQRWVGHFFQNGFFEEFLMRGALQTRLARLIAPMWALMVQAVVFGMWHVGAMTAMYDGDWLAGLANCLAFQSLSGVALGYIFLRTRNLVACSAVHVITNSIG